MHRSRFELSQRPFHSVPRTERYFPGATIEEARARLVRCIERVEGPALLIGPAGVGKTLLCQVLADHFRSELAIAHLASARLCSRRALLQLILFELGLPYREMEEGELRLSLIDRLASPVDDRPAVLLLVDEAHNIPFALLEEMRMITNFVRDGQPRVRLVLAGLPTLEERFANPKLECFNQRLAARCYLGAFSRIETTQYVRAQIAASQGDPDEILTADALEAVYHATDGVPRLINQLCDQALLSAGEGEPERLTGSAIEAAWSELQQLPTPWCGSSPDVPPADEDVIEFGRLDDLTHDSQRDPVTPPPVDGPCDLEGAAADVAATAISATTAGPGPIDEPSMELKASSGDVAEFVPAGTIGLEQTTIDPDVDTLEATAGPATPEEADLETLQEIAAVGATEANSVEAVPDIHPASAAAAAIDRVNPSPFDESYDDEEVVIDQYSALACDVFRQQPRVVSRGDGMPLHLLRQIDCNEDRPSLSLVEETVDTDPPQETTAAVVAVDQSIQCEPNMDGVVQQTAAPTTAEELVACCHDQPETETPTIDLIVQPAAAVVTVDTLADVPVVDHTEAVRSDATNEVGQGDAGDDDVIVIDDQDDEALGDGRAAPVTPVHAGQYRQLFARLRRA